MEYRPCFYCGRLVLVNARVNPEPVCDSINCLARQWDDFARLIPEAEIGFPCEDKDETYPG